MPNLPIESYKEYCEFLGIDPNDPAWLWHAQHTYRLINCHLCKIWEPFRDGGAEPSSDTHRTGEGNK